MASTPILPVRFDHLMDNLKLLFKLYLKPASAMSDIMDHGSWLFAAAAVAAVAFAFYATVNTRLATVYEIPNVAHYIGPDDFLAEGDQAAAKARYDEAMVLYKEAMANRTQIPLVGDRFFYFFTFEPSGFVRPLMLISIFYVPAVILLMSFFGGIGSFGLALRRDYGTLAVCSLYAWAAAHAPFALAGVLTLTLGLDPHIYLAMWAASGLLFGVLMFFAVRTVFGANDGTAVLTVSLAWFAMSVGMYVFQFVSPLMFSPFLLFYAFMYLGGRVGGEVQGFGNVFRQKQNFKRFLHNATVNPKDADAHVQLGIIYLQRRQKAKAVEHFQKAVEIDRYEIDANYELGKMAREDGELQKALDHFAIVVEHNDKHSLSEIWREIGATYLAANMPGEARDALERFVERRSTDVEGLYYLGKALKADGQLERARDAFEEAIANAQTASHFQRRNSLQWSKLARKEI